MMATDSAFNEPNYPLRTFLVESFNTLRDRMVRRATYRITVAELNSLSCRDLADLGIHRSAIKGIALAAAHRP